jgi:hypothetical protein
MTIEEVLDRSLEDIRYGHMTVEDCLKHYPRFAAQLRPLLLTALKLESVNNVRPSREFKARLREQLTYESESRRSRRSMRTVFILFLVLVLLAILLFSLGMVMPEGKNLTDQILPPTPILPSLY